MSWKKVKLGDIADCIQPGPFGSQLHSSDYADEGTPIVMPKDMISGRISHQDLIRVPDEHLQRLKRHQVYDGDLLVARKGDVRKCVYITENENGWLTGSDCLKVSLDKDKCYPKYIYYQLRSPFIGRWLETISIGATMPSLNTSLLSGIEISLPTIDEQMRIAEVLSTYDALIENNQKQIKLLEETAQRLYKEWFVALRFPGHENTPIINGIPQGWRREAIDNVYSIKYGKNLPTTEISDTGEYPVYGASKMIGYYSQKNCDNYAVLITSRGNAGVVHRTHNKESFVTNNSFIVLPKIESLHNVFVFFQMKQLNFKSIVTGACQQQLTNGLISQKSVVVPTTDMLTKFNAETDSLFELIEILLKQNECLIEARDRLLPKLMSGEIEV